MKNCVFLDLGSLLIKHGCFCQFSISGCVFLMMYSETLSQQVSFSSGMYPPGLFLTCVCLVFWWLTVSMTVAKWEGNCSGGCQEGSGCAEQLCCHVVAAQATSRWHLDYFHVSSKRCMCKQILFLTCSKSYSPFHDLKMERTKYDTVELWSMSCCISWTLCLLPGGVVLFIHTQSASLTPSLFCSDALVLNHLWTLQLQLVWEEKQGKKQH